MSEKVRCVISHLVLLQPLGAKASRLQSSIRYPSSVSGSGQEALHCLFPLPRLLFCVRGLVRPGKGQVDRRADEENDTLVKTRFLDLLVEFKCLSGKMSTHVEQYQVVDIGLPEKSCRLQAIGGMNLDVVTPQNDRSHVERRLVSVDEENFLPGKNRAATKWWRAIHTTLPKLERALEKRFARILLLERAGVKGEVWPHASATGPHYLRASPFFLNAALVRCFPRWIMAIGLAPELRTTERSSRLSSDHVSYDHADFDLTVPG